MYTAICVKFALIFYISLLYILDYTYYTYSNDIIEGVYRDIDYRDTLYEVINIENY